MIEEQTEKTKTEERLNQYKMDSIYALLSLSAASLMNAVSAISAIMSMGTDEKSLSFINEQNINGLFQISKAIVCLIYGGKAFFTILIPGSIVIYIVYYLKKKKLEEQTEWEEDEEYL